MKFIEMFRIYLRIDSIEVVGKILRSDVIVKEE